MSASGTPARRSASEYTTEPAGTAGEAGSGTAAVGGATVDAVTPDVTGGPGATTDAAVLGTSTTVPGGWRTVRTTKKARMPTATAAATVSAMVRCFPRSISSARVAQGMLSNSSCPGSGCGDVMSCNVWRCSAMFKGVDASVAGPAV